MKRRALATAWLEWVMLHIWMSHVTHLQEMSERCAFAIVLFEFVIEFVTHIKHSCHTYEAFMSLVTILTGFEGETYFCLRCNLNVNQSCHTCEWVTSHITTFIGFAGGTSTMWFEFVMLHMWRSHVTRNNTNRKWKKDVCLPLVWIEFEFVMSHICMSHVTHALIYRKWWRDVDLPLCDLNESCHTYEWVTSHIITFTGNAGKMYVCHCVIWFWIRHVTHVNESRHT